MLNFITNIAIPVALIMMVVFFLTSFFFDLLLRGFHPFIPSRPWVVAQIMAELKLPPHISKIYGFSSGRSGFLRALEKKYPNAELVGFETKFFPFLVARVQLMLRRTRIKVRWSKIHHIDVRGVDFIYCHLYPDDMKDLGRKLKFEARRGTQIVSTGFHIPHLPFYKEVDLPDQKGRLDFLSKNQNFFQSKHTKHRKQKKAYFYEI